MHRIDKSDKVQIHILL